MAGYASFYECLAEALSSLHGPSLPASTTRKEDIHQDRCNLPCSHASLLIQFVKQLLCVCVCVYVAAHCVTLVFLGIAFFAYELCFTFT